jgi:hypothetical protein
LDIPFVLVKSHYRPHVIHAGGAAKSAFALAIEIKRIAVKIRIDQKTA